MQPVTMRQCTSVVQLKVALMYHVLLTIISNLNYLCLAFIYAFINFVYLQRHFYRNSLVIIAYVCTLLGINFVMILC